MGNVNLDDLSQYIVVSLVGALEKIDDLRELDQPLDPGVYALWSDKRQSIVAFVFQKQLWDQAKARAWVKAAQENEDVAATADGKVMVRIASASFRSLARIAVKLAAPLNKRR